MKVNKWSNVLLWLKNFKLVWDVDKLAWDNIIAHISVVATQRLQGNRVGNAK